MNPQQGLEADSCEGVHVSALGVVIKIQFDERLDEDLRGWVVEAWSGATVGATESAATLHVIPGDSPELILEQLSVQVTLAALEASQGKLFTFHATGVATDDGRVIAFVGPSGTGKTTLARTLGKVHGYVSDETVGVDANMRVYPYRKPLSLVEHKSPKRQVSPAAAGLLGLPDVPLQLAALVLLNRDPAASGVEIEQVPLFEAMTQLLPEMSYTSWLDSPLQQIASLCERLGGVHRLTYHDASVVPEAIEQLLETTTFNENWTPARELTFSGAFLRPDNIIDAIACSGDLAVFGDQTLRILSGIAPVIWEAVIDGKPFEEIVQAVVDSHGMPDDGDPRTLVGAAIDDLIAEGILCRTE